MSSWRALRGLVDPAIAHSQQPLCHALGLPAIVRHQQQGHAVPAALSDEVLRQVPSHDRRVMPWARQGEGPSACGKAHGRGQAAGALRWKGDRHPIRRSLRAPISPISSVASDFAGKWSPTRSAHHPDSAGTSATSFRHSLAGISSRACTPTMTFPVLGSRSTIARSRSDLPTPDGPISARHSPAAMSKLIGPINLVASRSIRSAGTLSSLRGRRQPRGSVRCSRISAVAGFARASRQQWDRARRRETGRPS